MNTSLSVIGCIMAVSVASNAAQYPRHELLVEPAELANPAAAKQFIVLDVRPKKEVEKGHIAGAQQVDHDEWAKAFGDGKNVPAWEKRIGNLGIGPNSRIVVYDDKGMKEAARIWWILCFWGVKDVQLLNGGWRTWKAELRPVSEGESAPVASVEFKAKPHAERLATKDDVFDLLKVPGSQIVDSRSAKEFCGLDLQKNKRGGAIPGAKHLEWSDLVDQETHRMKSAEELRRLFNHAGIDLHRPMTTHCQSGGRASMMVFGLELMGAKDVRNYYQGWSEWGNLEDTPIVEPKKNEQ